jgi:hypothetical protein
MGDAKALDGLPDLLARGALAMAMNAALGFAIATIARSQMAGIGVGIGAYIGEGIAQIFLPDIIRWFPFAASSAVVARTGNVGGPMGGGQASTSLDPNSAVIVVVAWLAVALVAASAWTERAEISG